MTGHSSISYDVIVIGGGHNGLVTAGLLAKARRRVLVVERRAVLGGAAATEEVFPGFQVNTGGFDAGGFLPRLVDELHLQNHGLQWIESPVLTCSPQPGGQALTIWRDPKRTIKEIALFSKQDSRRYPEFLRLVARLSGVLAEMMILPPPLIPNLQLVELLPWLRPALRARRLGSRDFMALIRTLPMALSDFLDEWFESPEVKAAIGAHAITGSFVGPSASGTAFQFLYAAIGARPGEPRASRFAQSGAGALSTALAGAARLYGAEICNSQNVARILIENGRTVGVQLESGEILYSRLVVSTADPRHTLFDLVGAPELEVQVVRDVRNIRLRAATSRINLLLSDLPDFTPAMAADRRELYSGHIQFSPDLESVERAYDAAKYGDFSPRPYIDAVIPTLSDDGMASKPGHVMSLTVQYTPYRLRGGDWETRRAALVDTVIHTLNDYAPGFSSLVMDWQAITPHDLERVYGLTCGDIYHGQMGLDQLLFMRPIAGFSRYASPVEGLYLCGAGTHPGGGLTGAPGYNAAQIITSALDAPRRSRSTHPR